MKRCTWGRSFVGLEAEEVFRGSLSDGRPYTVNDCRGLEGSPPVLELGDAVMRGEDRAPSGGRALPREWSAAARRWMTAATPNQRADCAAAALVVADAGASNQCSSGSRCASRWRCGSPPSPRRCGVVREAMAGCVEGCVRHVLRPRPGGPAADVLRWSSGALRHPRRRARGMCALVGDLAYRCAELNPHLGLDAARRLGSCSSTRSTSTCIRAGSGA